METNPLPQEEVDLGTLFGQIGQMFSNIKHSIGSFFGRIYHTFIVILLFIRRNIIILAGATLIGVISGVVMGWNRKPLYTSDMVLRIAYDSGNFIYDRIDMLNNLIAANDIALLGKYLQIPESEARKIIGFHLEPIEPDRYMFLDYDDYMQHTDTVYTRDFTFDDFVKRKSNKDLRFQKINAISVSKNVFELINPGMKQLFRNPYFENLKQKKLDELTFEKEVITKNIHQIDSLRKRYKEIAYLDVKKRESSNSGVSFRTTNKSAYKGNADLDLYRVSDSLLIKLREVNDLIVKNEDVVRIQSEFSLGELKSKITDKLWFRYGMLGFLLAFLVLSGIQFNRYLNRYEAQLKS